MKNIKFKKCLVYFLNLLIIFITVIYCCKSNKAYAYVGSGGADHPYETFYTDGTYEYTMGLNFILGNNYSDHRFWDSNPNYRGEISTYNLRDKSTAVYNNDRRGWQYYTSEWYSYALQNQYLKSTGYCEYMGDSWFPDIDAGIPEGVQDGGGRIYTSGDGIWNRYRRAVIMIYRRPLPKPYMYNAYISEYDGGNYAEGSTLWIQPKKLTMRTVGCDCRSESEGQNSQYAENIVSNYILVKSIQKNNPLIHMEVYTDARKSDNFYDWYNAYKTGKEYLNDVSVFKHYEYGNAIQWGSYKYNGLGSEMTLTPPDGQDLEWKFDCRKGN